MILGLSHMGLTVSKLDSSLDYYQKKLGFTVLSDADRLPSVCCTRFYR